MSLKTHVAKNQSNVTARWLSKTEASMSGEREREADAKFFEQENIVRRIKSAGIKLKAEFKGKLGDDLKTTVYTVVKVDRRSGEVTLKNEKNTIRKINVMDDFFGAKKHRGQ